MTDTAKEPRANIVDRNNRPKIALIAHPVDLGNHRIAAKYAAMFSECADAVSYTFAPSEFEQCLTGERRTRRVLLARARSSARAASFIRQAQHQGRTLIFQTISAAMFCYPWYRSGRAYIVTDWTRKLYEPILGRALSSGLLTRVHRLVLNSATGIIGMTDAVVRSMVEDYGIPAYKVHKGRMPFEVHSYPRSEDRRDGIVRLLFIGGDFHRKGGDVLLEWYRQSSHRHVELTIVTQADITAPEGVRVIKNDPRFSPKDEFSRQDLLVLPTRCDSYPQVLGEAACAGLGVITTQFALGAKDIIDEGRNGIIVGDLREFPHWLDRVVLDGAWIRAMKQHSRAKMEAAFTYASCFDTMARFLAADPVPDTPAMAYEPHAVL